MRCIACYIDALNKGIGLTFMWLTLFAVLVQFIVVLMRYMFSAGDLFGLNTIIVQESILYAHGLLFMVCAAYTLLTDGHVRVDIFYREAMPRRKAWINLLGAVFLLLPVCAIIFYTALPVTLESWARLEGSPETSGIKGVYILRSAINVFAALMFLQGVSIVLRSIMALQGDEEELAKLRVHDEEGEAA